MYLLYYIYYCIVDDNVIGYDGLLIIYVFNFKCLNNVGIDVPVSIGVINLLAATNLVQFQGL